MNYIYFEASVSYVTTKILSQSTSKSDLSSLSKASGNFPVCDVLVICRDYFEVSPPELYAHTSEVIQNFRESHGNGPKTRIHVQKI